MDFKIRKFYTTVEEVKRDGKKSVEGLQKRASIAVVIENPYANEYVEDLSPLSDWSEMIAPELVERLLKRCKFFSLKFTLFKNLFFR